MNWVYVSFGTLPDDLPAAIRGLSVAGVRGMNVTMPHKVAAMEIVDSVTSQAEKIGALNTIEVANGELIGHNTDGEGLVRFIEQDLGVDLAGCRAVVLGSGGSARAAVSGLGSAGVSEICVLARNPSSGEALEPVAGGVPFTCAPLDDHPEQWISAADVIVHATPIGQKQEDPLIPPESIRETAVVVDLVYKPPLTPLIEAARERGAIAHSGLGMLLHQAASAFEIWTGVEPPIEAMSAAALLELAHFEK